MIKQTDELSRKKESICDDKANMSGEDKQSLSRSDKGLVPVAEKTD